MVNAIRETEKPTKKKELKQFLKGKQQDKLGLKLAKNTLMWLPSEWIL